MCVLCAAVPATLALGAASRGKKPELGGRATLQTTRPALPVTPVALFGAACLALVAAVYHTRLPFA